MLVSCLPSHPCSQLPEGEWVERGAPCSSLELQEMVWVGVSQSWQMCWSSESPSRGHQARTVQETRGDQGTGRCHPWQRQLEATCESAREGGREGGRGGRQRQRRRTVPRSAPLIQSKAQDLCEAEAVMRPCHTHASGSIDVPCLLR